MEDHEMMDVGKYLARIGMDRGGVVADIAGLKMLQRQHLLNVPFENLDIHWNRPITLDVDSFYRKIVVENRGGFCYELNGLFNELLRELGFVTRLLSACVAIGDGKFTEEYDHAAILVIIGEMQYVADVGFGSFSAAPLQFVADVEQSDDADVFMVRRHDAEYFEIAKQTDVGWKPEYMFKPLGHDLSEFEDRCEWQQTSSDSHFTKNKLCSILTVTGRKTLTDDRFIITENKGRIETPIVGEAEFDSVLLREFGIANASLAQSYSLADQYIN